jgi:hypothetical protein
MSRFFDRQVIPPACRRPAADIGLPPMRSTVKQIAVFAVLSLLLSGCGMFGLFGSSEPQQVTADANGISIKNGRESDQREFAAGYCGTLNKSAMLVASTPEDRRAGAVRYACK